MDGQKLIIRFESVRNTLGNTKGLCGAEIQQLVVELCGNQICLPTFAS